ncbi:hypothetical protein RCOM_1566570 [Ricinus communis]|uniref:Calmodulin binding protein n=1 Tax=Ricinus communis TaxID=3988 RepID=B9SNL8_RICCO|nr:hypothetical protein RCOM_1566570 [Ricinus communis]
MEYDGKSLLNFKQSKRSNTYRDEPQIGQIGYPSASNLQIQLSRLPASVTTDMGEGFSAQSQLVNPNSIISSSGFQALGSSMQPSSLIRRHAIVNIPEDGFAFLPYMATSAMTNYDGNGVRPSKAVVGWLKIKAAMRWRFFIRKKATERRAQLVELDDE